MNREFEVLDFIKKYIASKGYSPTIREIASALGYKSHSPIQNHLKSLVLSGMITVDNKKSRTIELLVPNEYEKKNETTILIPVLSDLNGSCFTDYLEIPLFMLNENNPKNLYVYKEDKSIYVINCKEKKEKCPSLVVKDDKFLIEMNPTSEIFGNIISEFKIY